MAVFKDAGVVVTTPSSGTYVIECIGNVGVLADMLAARVREMGGDDALRRAEEAFRLGSAEGTSSRPARGAKGSAARATAAPKPKREPSKTKAAIAAAKRRARIKAEKLAAEEEAKRASREALLRASRGQTSPSRTSHAPERETPLAARYDHSLDVERDVAEAAEAMRGMLPAAEPRRTEAPGAEARGAFAERGAERSLPVGEGRSPPPTIPSGSAERRRAVASAEAAAAALAAALREPGPGAFEPGSWVLERRAAAEAAAAAGSGRKPPRGADAREPFPFAPQEPPGAAGLALPSLARDVALLANEVASFRKETREGLASACASLERVVESIRESLRGEEGGAAAAKPVADARAPRGAVAENEDEKERETAAADEAAAAVAAVAPSPFERSAFVAEARALAALREERKGAKASSDGARGGGATAASEGAEEKDEARGGASPVSRRRGESGESASPDPSRSPPEVVPETPADENARAATSGGGGFERDSLPMRAPRSLP